MTWAYSGSPSTGWWLRPDRTACAASLVAESADVVPVDLPVGDSVGVALRHRPLYQSCQGLAKEIEPDQPISNTHAALEIGADVDVEVRISIAVTICADPKSRPGVVTEASSRNAIDLRSCGVLLHDHFGNRAAVQQSHARTVFRDVAPIGQFAGVGGGLDERRRRDFAGRLDKDQVVLAHSEHKPTVGMPGRSSSKVVPVAVDDYAQLRRRWEPLFHECGSRAQFDPRQRPSGRGRIKGRLESLGRADHHRVGGADGHKLRGQSGFTRDGSGWTKDRCACRERVDDSHGGPRPLEALRRKLKLAGSLAFPAEHADDPCRAVHAVDLELVGHDDARRLLVHQRKGLVTAQRHRCRGDWLQDKDGVGMVIASRSASGRQCAQHQ